MNKNKSGKMRPRAFCETTPEERLARALEAAANDLELASKWAKEDKHPRTAVILREAALKYRKLAAQGGCLLSGETA